MENDYVKRILKVLVYIEERIDEEMTLEELAKVACYSQFHFHRLFQMIVGESVHKYIRRLRLEKAAGKLRYTDAPITTIALDANFDTSSAFTRVFKQCMGKSPRNYRSIYKEMNQMKKKIEQLAMIKPDKIEKIADIPVLFIRRVGDYVTTSESAWDAMRAFILERRLDPSKIRYFSSARDNPHVTEEENLRFDACIQTPEKVEEIADMGHQVLKGGKMAVFTHLGPHEGIDETYDRILFKWFPESGQAIDDSRATFVEHFHLEYIDKNPEKLVTKLFIPIA